MDVRETCIYVQVCSVCVCSECYSEASDQEEESMETPCPLYSEQLTTDSVNVSGQ